MFITGVTCFFGLIGICVYGSVIEIMLSIMLISSGISLGYYIFKKIDDN